MSNSPLITLLTLTPLVGGIVVLGLGSEQKSLARKLAFAFSLLALGLAVILWLQFNRGSGVWQFEQRYSWIRALGVEYHVAVDGLGLLLLMLSAIVVPMAMLASWRIEDRVPLYFGLVLFLQIGRAHV
jgi:NADH-quinone oxidoreductase subunit M